MRCQTGQLQLFSVRAADVCEVWRQAPERFRGLAASLCKTAVGAVPGLREHDLHRPRDARPRLPVPSEELIMSDDFSDLDKRKEAARRGHHGCKQCGGMYTTTEVDGKDCGGLPGITYKVCRNCGRATAKVSRRKQKPFS